MQTYLAEAIGTLILVLLGDGVVANVLLERSKGQNSGWIVISVGWGVAVAEAVVARERRYQRPVSRVTLTFWRTEFDRATLYPSERPVRTFVYDVP